MKLAFLTNTGITLVLGTLALLLTSCGTPEQKARLSKTATTAFDLWLKRAERDGTLAKNDVADLRELKEAAVPTATPSTSTK